METLRCNECAFLKEGFCTMLNQTLPDRLAKLFFGGAVGLLAGTVSYPSQCGIEKQQKQALQVFVPHGYSAADEDESLLADPIFVIDNSDW